MFEEKRRKNKKHDFTERIVAVRKVLNDHVSVRAAAKEIGADHMQVKYWVSICERHGEDSLLPRRLNYSGEFKVTVIEDMYTNKLTLYDTALKYCIPSPSTVLSWKRLYDTSGSAGLYSNHKMWSETMRTIKSKQKNEKSEEASSVQNKSLQKEVEYLRAENAYLKKLQALVQQRIDQEKGSELPPSKN